MLDGKKYMCCISHSTFIPIHDNFQHPETQELRRKIWNGEKIPHCKPCYDAEKNNVVSYRQRLNEEWMNLGAAEYFETLTEDTPPQLMYYDLRYDAKCNLACITCTPDFSTLWKKELGIPIKEYKLDINYDDILKAKKIYFAGGEPLIIDQYLDLLKFLAKNNSDAQVIINTNLTALKDEVLECIQNIKNMYLTISVDSYGRNMEYVRYPLQWEKFINNLEIIQESKIEFGFNTVASAVSVFGWERLGELEHFNPSHWGVGSIVEPVNLQLKNIPEQYKQLAYDRASSMKQTKRYAQDPVFKSEIDGVLFDIMLPAASQSVKFWITGIDRRRKINHVDYIGVDLLV
jgi:sulfatase maturation enzyme AslB (radical SAM superfamily)